MLSLFYMFNVIVFLTIFTKDLYVFKVKYSTFIRIISHDNYILNQPSLCLRKEKYLSTYFLILDETNHISLLNSSSSQLVLSLSSFLLLGKHKRRLIKINPWMSSCKPRIQNKNHLIIIIMSIKEKEKQTITKNIVDRCVWTEMQMYSTINK